MEQVDIQGSISSGKGRPGGEQEGDDALWHAQHVGAGGGGGIDITRTAVKTVNTTFNKTVAAQNCGVERIVACPLRQRFLRVEQPPPLVAHMARIAVADPLVQGLSGAGLRGLLCSPVCLRM